MGNLTKAQMVERLVGELGFSRCEANGIVAQLFDEIAAALEGNEPVRLSGFGSFNPRDRGGRPGRNPKTGEAAPIDARRAVTFRPGRKLQARVEAGAGPQSKG